MKLGYWMRNFGIMYPKEREFLMEHKNEECVVFVAESLEKEIFIIKGQTRRKKLPYTRKVIIKTDKGYYQITRHEAAKDAKITILEPALIYVSTQLLSTIIWKDDSKYQDFMDEVILDKI